MLSRNFVIFSLLLIVGCQPNTPDLAKTEKKTRRHPRAFPSMDDTPLDTNAAETLEATFAPVTVTLIAGVAGSPLAPRYSPPGKRLDLKPVQIPSSQGFDGLETEIVLGPPTEKQNPIKILVARAASGETYSKMIIDADAKAEKPLEFRHDIDEAIAEAAEKKLRCFIKFETTWCGPCRSMTQYVFTAKDVVDASSGIICVKVDGDERKDLVERYSVKAFPTGLLLSEDATESSRIVGYQTVTQMVKFLQPK